MAAGTKTTLADLLKLRQSLGQQIQMHHKVIAMYNEQTPIPTIRTAERELTRVRNDLDLLHNKIIIATTNDEDIEDHSRTYIEFVTLIGTMNETLITIQPAPIPSSVPGPSVLSTSAQSHHHNVHSYFPKMSLPTFDGKYEDWLTFRDLFRSTIINNTTLPNSVKFWYLHSALKGEAATVIKGTPITDDNFQGAWQLMEERYHNRRELIFTLIEKLVNFPKLKQENSTQLRKLIDCFKESLTQLETLNEPTEHWDSIIVYLLKEKMDPDCRRDWTKQLKGSEVPNFSETKEFLENYIRGLKSTGSSSSSGSSSQSKAHSSFTESKSNEQKHKFTCPQCQGEHGLFKCDKWLQLSVKDRFSFVKKKNLCTNCLSSKHNVGKCQSKYRCRTCQEPHNTLLHFDTAKALSTSQQNDVETSTLANHCSTSKVLLSTAVVKLIDAAGEFQECRILLDQGSESNFISDRCVSKLGFARKKSNVTIVGISGSNAGKALGQVTFDLCSRISNFKIHVNALILQKVTGFLPSFKINSQKWTHLMGIQLADPNYTNPRDVDIILGAEFTASVTLSGKIMGPPQTPIAQETTFGWVISGPTGTTSQPTVHVNHASVDILQKFWELEELPKRPNYTIEEQFCEDHFVATHTRNEEGRYVVRLPLNENISKLGDSRDIAVRRLQQVEKRLRLNPVHHPDYIKFMDEYQKLGHMEVATAKKLPPGSKVVFLPHHFVLKESSTTTKLRVVFDGSAKTSSDISLNQCLQVGPTVQGDIFTLLLQFRKYPIALKGDVTKMYRQFLVHEDDQCLQSILWRKSHLDPIQEFRLKTITYGTASAPFSAVRCLRQLAFDDGNKFPLAKDALLNNFYVDDFMGGSETEAETIKLRQELTALVSCAKLEICKFDSNSTSVLKSIPEKLCEFNPNIDANSQNDSKALGVSWDSRSDTFHFSGYEPKAMTKLTKRTVLAEISRVFDPLGFLAPLTIVAKIFLQKLWLEAVNSKRLQWDDELPAELQEQWTQHQGHMVNICKVKIPRCIKPAGNLKLEIHAFSDASESAYCGAVFLRVFFQNSITVNLIAAKTKVAPLKQQSLPKLELCGAHLVSKLVMSILESTKINAQVTAWSDSEIVLKWLRLQSRQLKTFVANRVSAIQEKIPAKSWKFIPGLQNPADCGTRGMTSTELLNCDLWWHGPSFLQKPGNTTFETPDVSQIPEVRKVLTSKVVGDFTILSRFSNLNKLIHVICYVKRFVNNLKVHTGHCHPKVLTVNGPLTVEERACAVSTLVKLAQQQDFQQELDDLKVKGKVSNESKLAALSPFQDRHGILRIGGRLGNSSLPESQKHQIILNGKNPLATLIIRNKHHQLHHAGYQLLWSNLQTEYWFLKARVVIRQILRLCMTCKKLKVKVTEQLMGQLPKGRTNPSPPFTHAGVDFAGPFVLQELTGRGKKHFNGYFCIFVCFATKAVHLEAVTALSTEAFIATLKRFVSRRGLPVAIYSDCGSNFVGAERELRELVQNQKFNSAISDFLGDRGVQWHFNPPSAPSQGGYWEAGVKSTKYHLRRIIGTTTLTLEELFTVLCQVEAVLNSRPICPLSPDPNDLEPLTPGHFLINNALCAIPDPDLTNQKENRLSRWQRTTQMVQHFWTRWHKEYINSLQEKNKWRSQNRNIAVGDLVIIKEDDTPQLKWRMGRVLETFPGPDGLVRVVKLKTNKDSVKRPVSKVCVLLPAEDQNSDDPAIYRMKRQLPN